MLKRTGKQGLYDSASSYVIHPTKYQEVFLKTGIVWQCEELCELEL